MGTLKIDDVCFAYDDDLSGKHRAKGPVPDEDLVLKHLSIEVPEGEFLCLVGHSGCGKTTLLRTLAGLQKPSSGAIYIDDKPLSGPGLDRAVVFQNYSLFPWMTAVQNVEFGLKQAARELGRSQSKEQRHECALQNLDKVGMKDAAELKPYQLSGGMQQRVAIARALAMDTEIMLFDEPFGALDVKTRRELQMLMQDLRASKVSHKTAVFVTHDIDEALILADRVVFMSAGRFEGEFAVEAQRPRDPEKFVLEAKTRKVRDKLIELFYNSEEGQDGKATDAPAPSLATPAAGEGAIL